MLDDLNSEVAIMIKAHLYAAFPVSDRAKAIFDFMEWFYRAPVGDKYEDAAGGVWIKNRTSVQQLLMARYVGRYIDIEGERVFKHPTAVHMCIIQQNPSKSPFEYASQSQRLVAFGYDVAQIRVNSKYIGRICCKEEWEHPNAEGYFELYQSRQRESSASAS